MAALPDSTRVLTKHTCPDCYKGKIPHENSTYENSTKLYTDSYCPTCEGTGMIQYWATLVEISQACNKINTILASGK